MIVRKEIGKVTILTIVRNEVGLKSLGLRQQFTILTIVRNVVGEKSLRLRQKITIFTMVRNEVGENHYDCDDF